MYRHPTIERVLMMRSKTYKMKALCCRASVTHYPNGKRVVIYAVQVAVNQMNLRDND